MVGAVRFELTTSCTPSKRAYQATLRPDRSVPPAFTGRKRLRISRRVPGNSTHFAPGQIKVVKGAKDEGMADFLRGDEFGEVADGHEAGDNVLAGVPLGLVFEGAMLDLDGVAGVALD